MSQCVHIDDDYRALLSRHQLGELESAFVWQTGERLDKPGLETWRQRWRVRLGDDTLKPAERTFYLKRFDHPPLRRQFQRWRQGHFLLSTAGIEWRNAQQLSAANIATAEPAAFGQQMCGPWERRSYVLLAEVQGESLERWVPKHLPPANQERQLSHRRTLVNQLARFIARFHKAGFVHRDLYLAHIFINNNENNNEPRALARADDQAVFTLIDLQRVFRPSWRHRRWVVKDLASLNFSTPADRVGLFERLRFLCRFTRECGRFGSARQLAPLIAAKTERIARHVRRRPEIVQGSAAV